MSHAESAMWRALIRTARTNNVRDSAKTIILKTSFFPVSISDVSGAVGENQHETLAWRSHDIIHSTQTTLREVPLPDSTDGDHAAYVVMTAQTAARTEQCRAHVHADNAHELVASIAVTTERFWFASTWEKMKCCSDLIFASIGRNRC